MLAITNSSALQPDRWQSASYSSGDSTAQLSGACALLALLVQAQGSSQSEAKADVEINAEKLEELKQQLAEAIQKAKEASEHSGFLGFLGDVFGSDIAQIAGAVAAVAAIVATAGAAAPLLMIAIAEGLQLAAKAGAELGLDPKLCMALSLASIAVGLCTGTGELQAATAIAQGARDVKLVAEVIQGGATATGGLLNYSAATYHADSLRYQANAVLCRAHEEATNLDFNDALSMLQRSLKTAQFETSAVSSIVRDDTDTNTALSHRI